LAFGELVEEGKVQMKKRKRRSSMDVKKLQERFLQAVRDEGRISLTGLIMKYGPEVEVKNTPSDKNLVKRQMDQLAARGEIEFRREGRELIALAPEKYRTVGGLAAASFPPTDLNVIKAYAVQLEEFSRTLQAQISTLVRMIEKSTKESPAPPRSESNVEDV
jgi:hypothetical protein